MDSAFIVDPARPFIRDGYPISCSMPMDRSDRLLFIPVRCRAQLGRRRLIRGAYVAHAVRMWELDADTGRLGLNERRRERFFLRSGRFSTEAVSIFDLVQSWFLERGFDSSRTSHK